MLRLGSSVMRTTIVGGLLLAFTAATPVLASSPRIAGAALSPLAWSAPERAIKGNFDQFSSVVDSHNHVHIAVTGGGNLYYATDRTGTWTRKLVLAETNNYTYEQPSIALDENDRVHIAVGKFPNGEGDKGIWYVSDVGRPRDTFPSKPTKIAPTGNGEGVLKATGGHLFLVDVNGWCCAGEGTVQMRTNVSGSWTVSSIGQGEDPSFRLGTDGSFQVAFDRNDTQPGIYYGRAATASDEFATSKIQGTSVHDSQPLLAIDSANRPWVEFQHFSAGASSIIVQHHTSNGWTDPDTAISGISAENAVGFDLDTLDRPNVAYGNVQIWALLERHGVWHKTTIAKNANATWLVLRRALNGGSVVAWTGISGIFVARR